MTGDDAVAGWIAATQAFQVKALTELEGHARSSTVGGCAEWLTLERHLDRLLSNIDRMSRAGIRDAHRDLVSGHREVLAGFRDRIASEVATFDAPQRRDAERAMPLRVAVIGKGGSGKSVISGTLSRLLARGGRRVLLVDLDTAPGVCFSVGLPASDGGLPPEALDGDAGWLTRLAPELGPVDAVERYAIVAPDGVRYLESGKLDHRGSPALQRSLGPLVQILANFSPSGWDLIADFEAGPRGAFNNLHLFADLVVIVVSPMWKSAHAAHRLRGVVTTRPVIVVANRWQDQPDFDGLEPLVRIPDDPAIADADHLGVAPIDHDPGSPAIETMRQLATMLRDRAAT